MPKINLMKEFDKYNEAMFEICNFFTDQPVSFEVFSQGEILDNTSYYWLYEEGGKEVLWGESETDINNEETIHGSSVWRRKDFTMMIIDTDKQKTTLLFDNNKRIPGRE